MGAIFTYLLTFGGAFVSIFYPFVGLLIYICFAILRPEAMWFWDFKGGGGNFSRIVAVALLSGWAIQGFGKWDFGRAKIIVFAIIMFMIWTTASWPFAGNELVARAFVENLFKIVLPFLVGMTMIDSVQKLRQLAWVIVGTQGYVAYELNMSYLRGVNRVLIEGYGGMDNNSVAIGMVTGVGLAFFLGLGAKNWWAKAFAFGSALMMAHVVLISFSRGGMVALIITGVVGFLLTPRRPIHYAAFAAAVMVVLALSGNEVRERFRTVFVDPGERDKSSTSRLELWGHNWDLMKRYPIFGVGPHQWPEVAPEYGWDKGKEGHSLWLQIGAELGFPGLIFLLMFYIFPIVRLWPYTSERSVVPDPFERDVARMVVASLVGFAVSSQFVSVTFLEIPYYVVLLGAGTLKLLSLPQTAPVEQPLYADAWAQQGTWPVATARGRWY